MAEGVIVTNPVMPTYGRFDLAFERGEGVYLFAEDGTRYLDFCGGIAVTSLGHAHPRLVQAIQDQAGKLMHTSNLYRIPLQEQLAQHLCDSTFADLVFFTNSGTEAMECSFKTARRYHFVNGQPERYRIITMEGAFHGRSLAAIAAGGQEKHLEGFGPTVDGFDQVPFGDMDALQAAITPETAAILVEPVQGEGGINALAFEALEQMRLVADDNGLLLIFDEVQCGVGRTGKLFAHEWTSITPDIMAVAKGIGGGFPLGACLTTAEAGKGMTAGTHGSTYGGNPLAAAAGNAVLDVVDDADFLAHVEDMGGYLGQKLSAVIARHPGVVTGMRGIGLMRGIECAVTNLDLVHALTDQKMLTVGAGGNVVRLLPPLTVTQDEIDEAVAAIDAACTAIEEKG
jgi:acetylornithine/N-succinyldiaminopimelate aminotransferase